MNGQSGKLRINSLLTLEDPFECFDTILQNENCRLPWNRTQIVRVGGKHADHLTTTTAQMEP